jgi:hypothetical protein
LGFSILAARKIGASSGSPKARQAWKKRAAKTIYCLCGIKIPDTYQFGHVKFSHERMGTVGIAIWLAQA